MKTSTVLVACVLAVLPARLSASFERSIHGTRSRAMGQAFVSLGDDASTLFINAAGLVTVGSMTLYGDYGEPPDMNVSSSAKGCMVLPVGGVSAGAGWYRLGRTDGITENLFVTGIAKTLLRGTQGSFLSVGATLRAGRILSDPVCGTCGGRISESAITGDLGVMLRPLPILSIGYSMVNVRNAGFGFIGASWPRTSRWGVSYFWEEKVVISYGQEHAGGETRRQYGFSVRTALPLELMGGFSDGNVSGGMRLLIDRFRASAAFSSSERYGVEFTVSLEILFALAGKEKSP
jgi:hypothetical protein